MHHIACHQWSKFQLKLTTSGYSRKNPNRGVKSIPFYPPLGIFKFVTLPQEIPEKTGFHPWAFHYFFLHTRRNSTSFLIDAWNFYMFFLHYPWKFHVLNPRHYLNFFQQSPFWGVLAKNLIKSKSSLTKGTKTGENLKQEELQIQYQ